MRTGPFLTATSRLSAFTILTGLTLLYGCKGKVRIDSAWVDQTISVDGHVDDWGGTLLPEFSDQKATVGIANDSTHLYLLLKFTDPQMARLITTTGLRLEFRDNTDQNSLFILRYHGGPMLQPGRPGSDEGPADFDGPTSGFEGGEEPGFDMPGGIDRKDKRMFTCEIKDRIIEKDIPTDGAEGPQVAFATGQGMFCYEFSIPLARGAVRYYGLGVEPGGQLLLTAVWGDRSEVFSGEKRPGGLLSGLGGGMPMGGGGGPSEGGMPGGGPGGGFGSRNLPEKQEVRFVINLSEQE
jgi:hypothetical protein